MKSSDKIVYINLRAEVIKHFHDTENEGKFENGFPLEHAKKIAMHELESDLSYGELRLTFEDMLLNSLGDCLRILNFNLKARFKKTLQLT